MSMTEPEGAPDDVSALTPDPPLVEEPAVDTQEFLLTQGWDRCDQCGAQAYVQVAIPTAPTLDEVHEWLADENRAAYETIGGVDKPKSLLFCKHHADEHEKVLEGVAVVAADERSRLDVKIVSSY